MSRIKFHSRTHTILFTFRRTTTDDEDDQRGLVEAENEGGKARYDETRANSSHSHDMRVPHDADLVCPDRDCAGFRHLIEIRDEYN